MTMADGAPLSDNRTYSVVMNDFLATGGEDITTPLAVLLRPSRSTSLISTR